MLLKALSLSGFRIVLMSGCSTTLVSYTPQATGPLEKVKYTQGVGTLSLKDVDQEVFMYPTFKAQGPVEPTFTIGYANNASAEWRTFRLDNIKAYFRRRACSHRHVRTDKIAAIRNEKLGQRVGLAILEGLAAQGSRIRCVTFDIHLELLGGGLRSRWIHSLRRVEYGECL